MAVVTSSIVFGSASAKSQQSVHEDDVFQYLMVTQIKYLILRCEVSEQSVIKHCQSNKQSN
jgi:hypothetical protein